MEQPYTAVLGLDEFVAARDQLSKLANGLVSPETMRMQHGEVENQLMTEGTELLRTLFQGHLDLRAKEEPLLKQVIGAEDQVLNHRRRDCGRGLMSLFGEVRVSRIGYSQRGKESLFPLDGMLNLSDDKYSDGIGKRVGEQVALNSYDEAVSGIERTTGGKVPKAQAEQLVVKIAQDFDEFYEDMGNQSKYEPTEDPLILTFDGKGIVMRPEGLRAVTRKAAEKENHKLTTRLSKGEKRNRKRMAQLASVHDVARHVRSAEQVLSMEPDPDAAKKRVRNKRVWASVKTEASKVIEQGIEEALRRDPEKKRLWAVLVDGQDQQLKSVKAALAKHGVHNVVFVLDFVHVLEYLWKAVLCFEAEGSKGAERWVAERMLKILRGQASNVARGIRQSATLRGLSAKQRQAANTCAAYLLKYSRLDMLNYDDCLKQGLPIGTGVIEGACRHLVKDRMDITGARWGLDGAEAVLRLRSLRSSEHFDKYWQYHKDREFRRLHADRFHNSVVPLLRAA